MDLGNLGTPPHRCINTILVSILAFTNLLPGHFQSSLLFLDPQCNNSDIEFGLFGRATQRLLILEYYQEFRLSAAALHATIDLCFDTPTACFH